MIRFFCRMARRLPWSATGFALLLCWASGICAQPTTEIGWPEAGLTLRLENGTVTGRNAAGAEVIAPRWEWIAPLGDIAEVQVGEVSGLIDTHGRVLVTPRYSTVQELSVAPGKPLLVTHEANGGEKYGLISRQGREIIPARYDVLEYDEPSGHFRAKLKGREGAIRADGKIVVRFDFETVTPSTPEHPRIWKVYSSGKQGLIDIATGQNIVPLKLHRLSIEGDFVTTEEPRGGEAQHTLYNIQGKRLWSGRGMRGISVWAMAGLAVVYDPERGALALDSSGRAVIGDRFETLAPFGEAAIAKDRRGKIGLIDVTGKNIGSFDYDDFYWLVETGDGVIVVLRGGRYGVIDKRGHTLVEPAWDEIDYDAGAQRFWVRSGDKLGVLDLDGKVLFAPRFDDHRALSEKDSRHIVAADGRMGLADIGTGKLLIPIEYERLYAEERTVGRFSTVAARLGGKWGFITLENRVVVPLEYENRIGEVDYDTGIAWMRRGERVVQVSVVTPEQRTALDLQGVIGVNLPEATPFRRSYDLSHVEERFLPRNLASESAIAAAVEGGTLREMAYPSILLHGDHVSVGFGNFVAVDPAGMISRPALCRSDDGFDVLIDSGESSDCADKRQPRLRFKRRGDASLSCLNCDRIGLPSEWLRSDKPLSDGTAGYARCAMATPQDAREMGSLYRAWLSRFEAEVEAFFAVAESGTEPNEDDAYNFFVKSVVRHSRMSLLLRAVVAGGDELPSIFHSAPTARARIAILMEALRQADPVSSGGSFFEPIRALTPCATAWYLSLAGKSMPLPPPGTLVRDVAPFLTLIHGAEGIRLAGLSEEFISALDQYEPH